MVLALERRQRRLRGVGGPVFSAEVPLTARSLNWAAE